SVCPMHEGGVVLVTTDDTESNYEKGPQVADYEKGDDTEVTRKPAPALEVRPDAISDDTVTAKLAKWEALLRSDPLYIFAESLATLDEPQSEHARRQTTLASVIAHAGFAVRQPSTYTAMPALLGFVRDVRE